MSPSAGSVKTCPEELPSAKICRKTNPGNSRHGSSRFASACTTRSTKPRAGSLSLYFPDDAMISLVTQMKSGASVEVGVVGRYGMAGLPVFLGSEKAPSDAFVQVGGTGFKIGLADFRALVTPTTRLHARLLAYTNSFLFQASQAAACNALHHVEQRSARWLLMVADQIGADEFELTHEFLAQMLGVRRAGVTEAQAILPFQGPDRGPGGGKSRSETGAGLEKSACECFGVIHRELEKARAQAA